MSDPNSLKDMLILTSILNKQQPQQSYNNICNTIIQVILIIIFYKIVMMEPRIHKYQQPQIIYKPPEKIYNNPPNPIQQIYGYEMNHPSIEYF